MRRHRPDVGCSTVDKYLWNATRNTGLSVDGDTMSVECNEEQWAVRWRRQNVCGMQQETLGCSLTETQCLWNATRNTGLSVDGDTMPMECNKKHWTVRWRRHNVYGMQQETMGLPLTETQCLWNATRNTRLSVDGDTMSMEYNKKHWTVRWRRHNVYGMQQETMGLPLTETQCLWNTTRNTGLSVDGDTMYMECNKKHWAVGWRRHNVYGMQQETLGCRLTET